MADSPGGVERLPTLTTADILAARPARHAVDPLRPYAWLVEQEVSRFGQLEEVATLFLTNRECPFHCLFCDLWKHTLTEPTPHGAVLTQIEWALAQLPPTRHIKLYNSGNFFDAAAVPTVDLPDIARRVAHFETVIVENHPRLCRTPAGGDSLFAFRDQLHGRLEVAMGLETIDPQVVPRLNKQMTPADWQHAAHWLRQQQCDVRAFVLLRLPGQTAAEGVHWAIESVRFAQAAGATCCSVIPVRAGNGSMEQLQAGGWFTPPTIHELYEVLATTLAWQNGRVQVDLWDIQNLWTCATCGPVQTAILQQMNFTQQVLPWHACQCDLTPYAN